MILRSLEQLQPPPTAPSPSSPLLPSRNSTIPPAWTPVRPQFGGFMVIFQQQLHPLLSNLCFTYFPAAIICGSGVSSSCWSSAVWRCSAALSRETRDAHGDIGLRTLQKEAELVTQRFLWAPGREKGVPLLMGCSGMSGIRPNAAQGWVVLKAPL